MISKTDIIKWKEKYDDQEDFYNKGDEDELRGKFQKKKFMTKEDLIKIHKWKFQGTLIGRQKRMINLIQNIPSSFIEELSRDAFNLNNDIERLQILFKIPSVANSLSSVILTFYDPQNYGILDIHSWRELFGEEPKDIFSNKKRLLEFLDELRKISNITGLSCREVEKALFKKNLDENKIGGKNERSLSG